MIQIAHAINKQWYKMVIDLIKVGKETLFINFPKIWELLMSDCKIIATEERLQEEIKEEAIDEFQTNVSYYLEQVLQKPVIIADGKDILDEAEEKGNGFFVIYKAQLETIFEEFEKYLNKE